MIVAPQIYHEAILVNSKDGKHLASTKPVAKEQWAIAVHYGTHKSTTEIDWKREEIIPVPFNEPFIVAAKGDSYFFCTESGKVYIAKKQPNGPRKVEVLWDNKELPIDLVFADNDRDKTYVFAKESKAVINAKHIYFELDEKPKVVEFNITHLKKPEQKLPPPLAEAWQLQQLLNEREGPPPKKP